MNKFKLMLAMILVALLPTNHLMAEAFIPSSDEQVLLALSNSEAQFIEQIHNPVSESKAFALAKVLLRTAKQPGKSQQYDLAQGVLAVHLQQSTNPDLWYLWAQIKQHQHLFTAADQQLLRIFNQNPDHVAARLMASRLALLQRDQVTAKQHCQALIGHTDIITTHICLLEVSSYEGRLDNSFSVLSALIERQPLPESHQTWVTLMLVDMAMRKNNPMAAERYLNKYPAFDDSSYLSSWSDVMLANQKAQSVMNKLSELIRSDLILEDGLMLRLALAEQQLNQQSNQARFHWIEQLEQRIALRAERGEFLHASEMARYYLFLQPNADQAKYWANLNWQIAKEHQDELLLLQAKNLKVRKTP